MMDNLSEDNIYKDYNIKNNIKKESRKMKKISKLKDASSPEIIVKTKGQFMFIEVKMSKDSREEIKKIIKETEGALVTV